MLSHADTQRALDNCHRVRVTHPVRFLQVLPDPRHADNVQLRIGQGPWQVMHVVDAIAFTKAALQRQRRQRLVDKKTRQLQRALDKLNQRNAEVQARQREQARQLDRDVRDTLKRGQSLLKSKY